MAIASVPNSTASPYAKAQMITLTNVNEARADAIEVLWQLLQERPDYANISHDGKTTRNQHVAFVHGHPYREWCLIMADSAWVGAVYITFQNEIGIAILKQHQRKGYARKAVDMMMQNHPRDFYLANVAPANHPSHKLWESFEQHAIVQLTYRIERGEQHGNRSTDTPPGA
jgi:RimJ/RimL family protein N-acetyltransferase